MTCPTPLDERETSDAVRWFTQFGRSPQRIAAMLDRGETLVIDALRRAGVALPAGIAGTAKAVERARSALAAEVAAAKAERHTAPPYKPALEWSDA